MRAYLALTWAARPLAKRVLRRRLAKGKEDPKRWTEKLGQQSEGRPDGKLIWINAVGLGEVLSLRGLIAALTESDPDVHVLVTSTTRDSARVFAANLPERCVHQFLPLDIPAYRTRFLDHWRPDASIWAEQDIWPGFVWELDKRGTPQAIIASRMDDKARTSRQKAGALSQAVFEAMAFISAQDDTTAANLRLLGAMDVTVSGSLKPGAPPLSVDEVELAQVSKQLAGRFVWSVVSSYVEDERLAVKAHEILRQTDPTALLILVPRQVGRDFGHLANAPRRSEAAVPGKSDGVWLADTVGDMGLILRLSDAVLIGGTFSQIEGHNPWEAATLGVASFHGAHIANFRSDFQELDKQGASNLVSSAEDLAEFLGNADLQAMGSAASATVEGHKVSIDALAHRILGKLDG